MSVAVKSTPEIASRSPQLQLMMGSLVGAAYILVCFWLIFGGLPTAWDYIADSVAFLRNDPFLKNALLVLLTIPVAFGLLLFGRMLLASDPLPGTRAGAVFFALAFVIIAAIGLYAGRTLEAAYLGVPIEIILTLVVVAALAAGAWLLFQLIAGTGWLQRIESQGWFHATVFKPSQGLRVRRGTFFALLVLLIFGVLTMVRSNMISGGLWSVDIPFTNNKYFPILYYAQLTVPVILVAASAWVSWRVVNFPAFADFLIATEAEMNKVSWTTRKKLVQDTIVVLVTVLLMTVFLFVVDIVWIEVLRLPAIRVLDVNPLDESAKKTATTKW